MFYVSKEDAVENHVLGGIAIVQTFTLKEVLKMQ